MSTAHTQLDVKLLVNGQTHSLVVEGSASLLDVLRDDLKLTGTKRGCDTGSCGACTVLLDGRRVNACLTLAASACGMSIITIEDSQGNGALRKLQDAFLEHDALQCGFCTPGQIMSALALLAERRPVTEESIRKWMSGNLCRCGAYPHIIEAILEVARERTSI